MKDYADRPDYQKRVIDERNEVDERLKKLTLFIQSDKFETLSVPEQRRMNRQHHIMRRYSVVLMERIEAFEVEVDWRVRVPPQF